MWSGSAAEVWRYAEGKRPRRGGGEGVSVNIMLGPGPSSVATRVMGTGFEVNLRAEACREREGRTEWIEEGRSMGLDSLMEEGLLDVPSEGGIEAFIEETLDMEADFLELSWLWREAIEDVRSVVAGRCGADVVLTFGGGEKGRRGVGSGTWTSRSPVDFLEGGGPAIESPWLFLLRTSFFLLGESLSDSKSSISASLAAL
jgi:hypothetical protein